MHKPHSTSFTSFNKNDCKLIMHRIDVWQFPLFSVMPFARDLLDSDEKNRADRFHFPIHRRRYIAAHSMQRMILARYLNSDADQIQYDYNLHGKPEISYSNLQFNLSHSRDLALLAVGLEYPIGIDVEFFSARSYEGIGRHIYSEEENKKLFELPSFLEPLGFFHLWSQKEAFIKACGLGLSYPTKQFSVPILPQTNLTIWDPLHHISWRMQSFMPAIACCAALCYKPEIQELRFLKLNDSETL